MKKLPFILVIIIALISCKNEKKEAVNTVAELTNKLAPISDAAIETAVIYEANIRQYSKEGTFEAFTKDIPQLKQLGVKIIWLMPVFPISRTKRKATGGDFASLIEDEATRNKMLGSYYAVSDFTKINSEFGTIDDFRALVQTAHENGIYVILDWVPNHTGWDHVWIKAHPEYYTKNTKGEITEPLNNDGTQVGWADVADLNYDNEGLRKEMITDMTHWITQEDIDGFRCDVAGSVPVDFWQTAITQLRDKKDIFMLAEAWEPELLKDNLFDMVYAWDGHHLMNALAKGKKHLKDWGDYMKKTSERYETNDILMNFVTNHDENSWSGTIKERMGDASELMTAFSYIVPGMPLIYSGQEYNMNHRLKFFEKDEIPKTKGNMWPILEKLGTLKNTNPALNGGKEAASIHKILTSNDAVLSIERRKNDNIVTFIGNFSNQEQSITSSLSGSYLDYMSNAKISFKKGKTIILNPWEYKILID